MVIMKFQSLPLIFLVFCYLQIAFVVPDVIQAQPLKLTTLYTLDSNSAGDQFGYCVSGAGDVNADGFADLIVGAHNDNENGPGVGSARVYSGVDGTILYTFYGETAYNYFGVSVSGAGDVNADGFADVIVGAYLNDNNGTYSGNAQIFSGIDGTVLYTFNGDSEFDRFGLVVSEAGDVNSDGFADVIVGADLDDNTGVNSGSARVFSGIDGALLYTFNGDGPFDYFGRSVNTAGDVNDDGVNDLIVGAPGDNSARVFSGIDGSILYDFSGVFSPDLFGGSVSGAGDVNGDGYDDVIVGAYEHTSIDIGMARVFSGADGSLLYSFEGDDPFDRLGNSVSGAGDINKDGFDDLLVGISSDDNNGPESGTTRIYSGADGTILYDVEGDSAIDFFGKSLSEAGDVNGDGVKDLIVGGLGVGSVRVFCLTLLDFRRGDVSGDGVFNLADPIRGLNIIIGTASNLCADASDANDDGLVDISDAVYLLSTLFQDAPLPPDPGLQCGTDPTEDDLGCETPNCP